MSFSTPPRCTVQPRGHGPRELAIKASSLGGRRDSPTTQTFPSPAPSPRRRSPCAAERALPSIAGGVNRTTNALAAPSASPQFLASWIPAASGPISPPHSDLRDQAPSARTSHGVVEDKSGGTGPRRHSPRLVATPFRGCPTPASPVRCQTSCRRAHLTRLLASRSSASAPRDAAVSATAIASACPVAPPHVRCHSSVPAVSNSEERSFRGVHHCRRDVRRPVASRDVVRGMLAEPLGFAQRRAIGVPAASYERNLCKHVGVELDSSRDDTLPSRRPPSPRDLAEPPRPTFDRNHSPRSPARPPLLHGQTRAKPDSS